MPFDARANLVPIELRKRADGKEVVQTLYRPKNRDEKRADAALARKERKERQRRARAQQTRTSQRRDDEVAQRAGALAQQ